MQLFSRLSGKPNLSWIEKRLFKDRNEKRLLEITGPVSSGKTELLLQIIINIILPKELYGMEFNGFEGNVVFIDTSYKFSILRMVMLIEYLLIKHKGSDSDSEKSEEFIENCLARFYKMSCSTSKELIVSLLSLEPFLKASSNVFLLVIDDLYAYHLIDRLESGHNKQTSSQYVETVLGILKRYVKEFSLNVILTKSDTCTWYTGNPGNQDVLMNRFSVQNKNLSTGTFSFLKKLSSSKFSFVCDYQITTDGVRFL